MRTWTAHRILVLLAFILLSCTGEGNHPQKSNQADTHSVVVTGFDPEWKIRAIKAVREATALGLADAKNLIEGAPSVVRSGLSIKEAIALEQTLEKSGMEIEVRAE